MASTLKLSKLAALVAMAASIMAAPQVAQADALAQSILSIDNFLFTFTPADIQLNNQPTAAVQSSATFANNPGTPTQTNPTLAVPVLRSITRVGPDSGLYTDPNTGPSLTQASTKYPGVLPGTFAGGYAAQSGSSIVGGADATSEALVSILGQGAPSNGSQGSNTVGQEFQVTVAAPGYTTVGISFDADLFLRAYLSSGPSFSMHTGNAKASTQWQIEVFDVDNNDTLVAKWVPGGSGLNVVSGFDCNGLETINCGGTSPFKLGREAFTQQDERDIQIAQSGSFTGTLDLLGGKTYSFSLSHTSVANADITPRRNVPEPGSLALAGLALLAAGAAASRRRRGS